MGEASGVFQLLVQLINDGQLSQDEETKIRKILEEKEEKKEKEGEVHCLAEITEKEIEKKIEENLKLGKVNESVRKLYRPVLEEYFWKSRIGKMPAANLSVPTIREFIIQAEEVYGSQRNNMICFMGLLQAGLDKMAEEKMINFEIDKFMFKNYLGAEKGIRYIDSPYTNEETEKIKTWAEMHMDDIRGLLVYLWFCGETSPEEIANLRKEDCNKGIFTKWERARIIKKALEMHPENGEYVFMVSKKGRLERCTAQSFQTKLYHICNSLGIEYRSIGKNEAIVNKG